MHTIKAMCVNIVKEKTKPTSGEPTEYQCLQMLTQGPFIHTITGKIVWTKKINFRGIDCQGVQLLSKSGKYSNLTKLIDDNLETKYTIGQEISTTAFPEIISKNGRTHLFFSVVPDTHTFDSYEPHLEKVIDWSNTKWQLDKLLTLPVRFTTWMSTHRTGINYTIINNDTEDSSQPDYMVNEPQKQASGIKI